MCQNKTDSQKPFFGACAKVHAHATSMTTACRPASVVRGAFYILREEAPHGWPQSNRETLTICGRDLSRAARGKGSAPAFGASPSLRSPALHVLRTRSRPPFPPLGENVSALTGDDRFCNRLPPLRLFLVVDQVDLGFRRLVGASLADAAVERQDLPHSRRSRRRHRRAGPGRHFGSASDRVVLAHR